MKLVITLTLCILFSTSVFSQVYSNKEANTQLKEVRDSVSQLEYHYMLPILGEETVKKGFKLPLPAGISMQYLTQESDIIISDLMVGFNNGEMYDIEQIIRFDKSTTTSKGIFIRPDIWLFPFLNVYAIFGQSSLRTSINADVWLPDSSNTWNQITSFGTFADFNSTTVGFGFTPTIGLGGYWFALDMNMTWNDIPELEKPAFAFVLGPRLGKTINFSPESNLALWVGGMRVELAAETAGSLNMSELFDIEEVNQKLDESFEKVNNAQSQIDSWWDGLSESEQRNPMNQAKYETANNALESAGKLLNSIDAAANGIENSTVQYSLTKKPKDPWNFLVGFQYQLNPAFMIRGEYGFLGSRTQIMLGLQYRFGF